MKFFVGKMALLVFVLIAYGCTQDQKTGGKESVLLGVDNHTITLDEFNDAFELSQIISERPQILGTDAEPGARFDFLRELIEKTIILRRAEELEIAISDKELDDEIDRIRKDYPENTFDVIFLKKAISYDQWKEDIRQRLLVERVIQIDLVDNISVTAEEITSYYAEHAKEFSRPETVRVYQILLAEKDQAEKALSEIRKGASFQDMARAHSISPDRDKGGDLGFLAKKVLPEALDKVIFKIKAGRISSVVESDYGYHIFLVTEKKPAHDPDLPDLVETIRKRINEAKLDDAYGAWLARLQSRYDVQVNEELLK